MIQEYLLQYGVNEGNKYSGYFIANSTEIYNTLQYDTIDHILRNSEGKFFVNSNDTILIESVGIYISRSFCLVNNKIKIKFYPETLNIPELQNNSIILPSENFEIKLNILIKPNTLNYFNAKIESLTSENIYLITDNSIYDSNIFEVPIFMKISHKFPLT